MGEGGGGALEEIPHANNPPLKASQRNTWNALTANQVHSMAIHGEEYFGLQAERRGCNACLC